MATHGTSVAVAEIAPTCPMGHGMMVPVETEFGLVLSGIIRATIEYVKDDGLMKAYVYAPLDSPALAELPLPGSTDSLGEDVQRLVGSGELFPVDDVMRDSRELWKVDDHLHDVSWRVSFSEIGELGYPIGQVFVFLPNGEPENDGVWQVPTALTEDAFWDFVASRQHHIVTNRSEAPNPATLVGNDVMIVSNIGDLYRTYVPLPFD